MISASIILDARGGHLVHGPQSEDRFSGRGRSSRSAFFGEVTPKADNYLRP